jgi:hypothetical protein
MFNNFIFPENRTVCDIIWGKKYGTPRQATDNNIRRGKDFACLITKVTDKHSEYIIFIVLHGKYGYANAPQCYVILISCIFFSYKRSAPTRGNFEDAFSKSVVACTERLLQSY